MTNFYSGATLDLKRLCDHAHEHLPKYAVPVYVRLAKEMQSTTNNKQTKVLVRNEGIEAAKFSNGDQLYWLQSRDTGYVPFSDIHLESLKSGKAKL
jgi:hypothetical protein